MRKRVTADREQRERERERVLFSRWILAALLTIIRCGWLIEKLDRGVL